MSLFKTNKEIHNYNTRANKDTQANENEQNKH